ncbi:MAG: DUF934 domain-containing protein [Myxococcota bacterium]
MALFTPEGLVEDQAIRVDDEAPLPKEGLVMVSVARWFDAAKEEPGRIRGLVLRTDDPVDGLPPDLDRIEFEVERFTDGRVFTQARLLRRRHGFRGVISVTGPFLPDQAAHLFRCGVDAIVVPDDVDPEPWARTVARFPRYYQSAARGVGVRI